MLVWCSREVKFVALTAVLGCLSFPAVAASPSGSQVGGMWPVGLVSVLLALRWRGQRTVAVPVLVAVAFLTFVSGDFTVPVSTAYAVAIVVEGLATVAVLQRWLGTDLQMVSDLDVLRFLGGTAIGAAVGSVLFGSTAAIGGLDVWWHVSVVVFLFHWLSQLLFLGVTVTGLSHSGVTGSGERIARWALSLGFAIVAFYATDLPLTLLVMFPLLTWGALRASFRETSWQLIAVGLVASTGTYYGIGVFAGLEGPLTGEEFSSVPVVIFLLVATLMCLPLAAAVGRGRSSAADALRWAARLDNIITTAPGIAIFELDADGCVTMANPEAEVLTGRAASEIRGQWIGDLGSPVPNVTHRAWTRGGTAHRDPMASPQEWRPNVASGEPILVALSLLALIDEDGRTTGFVATGKDVTDRIHAQGALSAALDAERRAVVQLREVNEAKDAFVSTISHELRTPLTNIIGWLEVLTDDADHRPALERSALSKVESNSERLLHLIDSLLLLSKVESIGDGSSKVVVSLTEIVRDATQPFLPRGHRAPVGGHALTLHLSTEPLLVVGHVAQLHRVVTELCDNAVKYTPAGGTIDITLRAEAERGLVLTVADSGVGLAADEQAHVFDRFYRGSHANERAVQGAGLGLSLSREIARRHGGDLTVVSDEGRGSTFGLTLPPFTAPSVDLELDSSSR